MLVLQISRSFGTTGSQYLFVNIAGQLSAYSMNTGLKVLRTEDPKFPINDGRLTISHVKHSLMKQAWKLAPAHRPVVCKFYVGPVYILSGL